MRKKFKEVLERKEKVKRKLINKPFSCSEANLKRKIKEEEQLNMLLHDVFEERNIIKKE